jgi:hypothetical protein
MKTYTLKPVYAVIVLLCLSSPVKSQDKPVKFYDVIQDDSVVMYFNATYALTEAQCAKYKRYVRVDKNGDFFQSFTDSSTEHSIISKGFYTAGGAKNGYFELYYTNGNIKCKGNYKNNIEDGLWTFYYENGKPERTVLCTETAFLLMGFTDQNGNVTVKDGNGYFSGRVAADVPEYVTITASGKIVNGIPEGEWTSKYNNQVYCNETFKDGKFIVGDCPLSYKDEKRHYKNASILSSFFMPTYFYDLEQFKMVHCPDIALTGKVAGSRLNAKDFSFDFSRFTALAWDEIKYVMEFQAGGKNIEEYTVGENMLTISFTVDDKGVPENFKKTTSWGDQFYDRLVKTITKYTKFPPTKEPIYFHFKYTINEGNTSNYSIYFSRD